MKNYNAVTLKSGRSCWHLLEVVVYESFQLTGRALTGKQFGVLDRWSFMGGGRLREVVAHGGSILVSETIDNCIS